MAKLTLDDGERARYKLWHQMHLNAHHDGEEPYGGAIGGNISFTITGTSLGQILGVVCVPCRTRQKDRVVYYQCLTDFDEW